MCVDVNAWQPCGSQHPEYVSELAIFTWILQGLCDGDAESAWHVYMEHAIINVDRCLNESPSQAPTEGQAVGIKD